MCFLYRQSISIVYESKFKYIYRYFIKIDRCFCGILLSLPLRKCGLKLQGIAGIGKSELVTSLAEVWIEILYSLHATSLPYWSLPLRKCGLKCNTSIPSLSSLRVTSLAEVWIEIRDYHALSTTYPCHFPCGSVD